MQKFILIIFIFYARFVFACTSFGAITESGTIIAKNRDYFYNPQKFELIYPRQQFFNWYDNQYKHTNKFYAVTSLDKVRMGVNEFGLSAIQEDSIHPKNSENEQMYHEPKNGVLEENVLFGVLQNFNTVDEIIPFLSKIFSVAGPHFYQFADSEKILTVEVAFGKNNSDLKRDFLYKVITKKNDYFTHTNTYLSPEFLDLNRVVSEPNAYSSSDNRLKQITNFIANSKSRNIDTGKAWLRSTYSNVSSDENKNSCQNTSIFRSYLQEFDKVELNQGNGKIYGTVSNLIVENKGDMKKSRIYLMMLESIVTKGENKQFIKYKELDTSLYSLFSNKNLQFVQKEFERAAPYSEGCR